jgi:hypothetical protein
MSLCIYCGQPSPCDNGCPDPLTFDPTPIENALGLHVELDQ